ncbi:glycosyltransferase family 2 protein [Aliarcobacter thereius]|uniref:glycosyltransferase family 2 protein n=1 Tax=Aliarcobacter thereius TaxID=544718 RepID=UPI00082481E9|nr:glycosyltransferase family 2 protein [Aliarcobacter thereius]OCL91229.1 putative glycosyltransferase EpsE [Aliarcobacter thereius]
MNDKFKITILLSTYNGEAYLKEQLDSLFYQTYKNFEIITRDDGSSDDTLKILRLYDIKVLDRTQNLGAKRSFFELLKFAFMHSDSDYFMFCDQDDIWNDNKIEKTLEKMKEFENFYGSELPLLIHTDLEVVDESLKAISNSMWEYEYILPKYNSLNRLLIQNTITGCTMLINRELAKKSLDIPENAIMHDWWIGLVASCFGNIGSVNTSTIKYRQHGKNTIGAKGFQVNILRHALSLIKSLIFKDIKYLNGMQINILQAKAFLEQFKDKLDVETIKMLEDFITLEQKSWWQKRLILWKYKLLKQGFIRNVGLFLKI